MKVFVLCNSDILATNAIHYLFNSSQLAGIGVPDKHAAHLNMVFQSIGIPQKDICTLHKPTLATVLSNMVNTLEADCIIALTFPWKIPATIISQPKYGCINFHFGKLPVYRGADPIFWQLKNQEPTGAISVHYMNNEIDTGDILHIAELPIVHGETYGMHSIKLAMLAAELSSKLPALIHLPRQQQKPDIHSDFLKAPVIETLTIHWQQQSAASIIALANAANPKYLGAVSTIRQQTVRLLEVSLAQVDSAETFIPGTIVHADITYGLIVACTNNEFINIGLVHVKEGYLSGFKLFNMGLSIGEKFA